MAYEIDWEALPVDRGDFEFAADELTRGERIAYAKMLMHSGKRWMDWDIETGISDSIGAQHELADQLGIKFPMFRRILKKMFVIRADWQWRAPIITKVTYSEDDTP